MEGKAVARGAASIVNAISCGKGAAYGIDLFTKAKVTLSEKEHTITVKINGDEKEDVSLGWACVRKVLKRFGIDAGARVETDSNIPIARGLKSSSVAANAIVLATLSALDKEMEDLEIVKLGVEAAKEAGVTVTGAFDDACASYFGNVVVTDNLKMKVEALHELEAGLQAVIYYPKEKIYTSASSREGLNGIKEGILKAWEMARKGDIYPAMSINSRLYCGLYRCDQTIADRALEAGALGAGLSGTGPAFSAIVEKENAEEVVKVWKEFEGEVLKVNINRKKAGIL